MLSNRSLCWLRLGQADQALTDAKACRALKPDWPKACYREGAALRQLEVSFIMHSYLLIKLSYIYNSFRIAEI